MIYRVSRLFVLTLLCTTGLAACTMVERDSELEGAPEEQTEVMNAADLKPRAIARMQEALTQYRQIAQQGGWPEVPAVEAVEIGDTNGVVIPLRQRLAMTGDLPESAATQQDSVYKQQIAAAVAQFQRRHGLDVDSLLGPQTMEALNVPVEERVAQLEANMQELQALPDSMGARFLFVNIPEFRVRAFEQGREALQMPVIVGSQYEGQETPVFNDTLEHIIFRPYWNIPDSIAINEILPEVRSNPSYLSANNFEIVSAWGLGPDAETFEPSAANLARAESGELKMRQTPGPGNALGLVKFMFPNPYAIYLHGTPEDHLFQESARAFSHGCIRVSDPVRLAEYILQNKPEWNRQAIEQAMNQGDTQQVNLDETIPVYILYLTAYVDDSETVQFREDLYGLMERGGPSVAARANAE
jgi:L,D-transpeptidase YcbB